MDDVIRAFRRRVSEEVPRIRDESSIVRMVVFIVQVLPIVVPRPSVRPY